MTWTLAAELSGIDRVCDELAAWLTENNYADQVFSVLLLAREALNNAVIHGSHLDCTRQVTCTLIPQSEALILEVTDSGSGFNWQSALLQQLPDQKESHGRGLWIYHFYANQIEFNTSGNQVRLTYRIKKGRKE